MKRLTLIAAAALVAGCLPHPPPPDAPYRAVAQAPADWTLIIDDKHVTFIGGQGQTPLREPRSQPTTGASGQVYQTARINVNIVQQPCRDGRTSFVYPDTVQVNVNGRLHTGCGGL